MPFVRSVGKGFFPLDEALGLLPGMLTPHGHECLVRLAGLDAVWESGGDVGRFHGDACQPDREPEVHGRMPEQPMCSCRKKQWNGWKKRWPPAEKGADKLQISADGAMVPLVHGIWAEVKTLVVGEVQPAVEENGERVVHTRNLSYFSRKVNADAFQRLALVEMHRRGVEHAQEVAAIMDGAEWEQGFTDYHCPQSHSHSGFSACR